MDVRLTGVHLPLGAILGSSVAQVSGDAVHVTGTVTFATLETQVNAVLPAGLATVHIGDGGGGRLKLSVDYTGLGGPFTLSATARVSISHGRLTVTVPQESLSAVPAAFRPTVAGLLDQTFPLERLPLGLVATGIAVTPQGLTATADANDVVLRTGRTG